MNPKGVIFVTQLTKIYSILINLYINNLHTNQVISGKLILVISNSVALLKI